MTFDILMMSLRSRIIISNLLRLQSGDVISKVLLYNLQCKFYFHWPVKSRGILRNYERKAFSYSNLNATFLSDVVKENIVKKYFSQIFPSCFQFIVNKSYFFLFGLKKEKKSILTHLFIIITFFFSFFSIMKFFLRRLTVRGGLAKGQMLEMVSD